MPDACQRCRKPVLIRETTLGHVALFDTEPVLGGEWRDAGDGIFHRYGAGPRIGHRLHDRTCTEVVLSDLIPRDDDFDLSRLPTWNPRTPD